jgi:hypothetical protein
LWDDRGLLCHWWDEEGYPISDGMIQGPPSLMGWYRVSHHLWDDAMSTITYGMIQGLPSLMGWYRFYHHLWNDAMSTITVTHLMDRGTLHHPRCDMDISCYTQLIWKSYIIPQVMGTLYHPICDRDVTCHSHLMWKSYIILQVIEKSISTNKWWGNPIKSHKLIKM